MKTWVQWIIFVIIFLAVLILPGKRASNSGSVASWGDYASLSVVKEIK